jgi:hypothetical protein
VSQAEKEELNITTHEGKIFEFRFLWRALKGVHKAVLLHATKWQLLLYSMHNH